MKPLMFLLNLAWASRYRLPLIITVGFMVLDIRMTLDLNIQTRTIHRTRPATDNDEVDSDEDSWYTLEEVTLSDEE